MDLRSYLDAIRKSAWLVALLVVLGAGLGLAKAATTTPVYAGSVSFYISTPGYNSQTAFGSDQFAQDRANSYAELLSSQRLSAMIVEATGVPLTPAQVAHRISAAAELNTVLVKATIKDTSRERVALIAQGAATQLPVLVDRLDNGDGKRQVELNVVSGPSVRSSAVSPRTSLDVALGATAGLVLGLVLAVARDHLDTSVRTPEALEEATGVPVLASIWSDGAARRSPLIVGDAATGRRAEAYRRLRTGLRFAETSSPLRSLVVTSSVAAEGKTSTVVNLGLALAEAGTRVLVVDADIRSPQVAAYYGIEGSVGLTDVLAGFCSVDDVLQQFGDRSLYVLTSGQRPPNPSEMLGGPAFAELISDLERRFDIVIFDAPPLLPVADAGLLAAITDGVLLVFRHGHTKRSHVLAAVHSLRALNVRIVGAVVSMRPLKGREANTYGRYETAPPLRRRPRRHPGRQHGGPAATAIGLPALVADTATEPSVAVPTPIEARRRVR